MPELNITSNKDVDAYFSNKYAKSDYQKDTTPSPPVNKLIKRHLTRYCTARYPASNYGPTHSSAGYCTVSHSLIYIITLNNSGYISAATRNYRDSYQQHRNIDRNHVMTYQNTTQGNMQDFLKNVISIHVSPATRAFYIHWN